MADNYLDFTVRIKDEGSETLRRIGVSAEDLNKGIRAVKEETDRLNSKIVNAAQLGQVFDTIQQSVSQLTDVCRDLTSAYRVQLVAETQLQTVMRQRMSATNEEIQGIKNLASAQQALGVIGDEVQLSGAQQMATFLNEKASLDALIPAMNNLLAQQKGLNATNQDAVGIGNMMGKAMQGQVDVLQRVGVTFTDAQKTVLQYGSESERAAMLAQVIRDNVGEMNAELARTDAGKQKQLENTLGDVKEQMGALVQGAMPFLTIAAATTTTVTGVMRLGTSMRALTTGIGFNTASVVANTVHTRLQGQARIFLTTVTGAANVSTRALTISTLALGAAYTAGISLAIYAVCQALFGVADASDTTSEKQDILKESTDAYKSAASQLKGELDVEISSLSTLIKSHGDETEKVKELNRKYGEALGYHRSAAEWYDILIRKSADYCKAIGYEAQAKVLASQKAEKEMELEEVRKRKQALIDSGGDKTTNRVLTTGLDVTGKTTMKWEKRQVDSDIYKELRKQEARLVIENHNLGKSFEECMAKMAEGASALQGASQKTDVASMSYEELNKEIESTEVKLKSLAPEETAEITRLSAYNKGLKARKDALGKLIGLNVEGAKVSSKEIPSGESPDSGRPAVLDNLEAIDKELEYQRGLRRKCSKENLANIDKEIERLTAFRTEFENYSKTVKTVDDTGTPEDISQLNTIGKLSDAVGYYEKLQRSQSASELENTQRIINALNEKKSALERLTEIPQMQADAERLGGLGNKELKLELKLIGLDGIQDKIRSLQKMLSDTKNPINPEQQKEVKKLIESYQDYEQVLKKSSISAIDAWGAVKGIGSGIESMTNALEGNGNAWQNVVGIIDGFIAIYDGIRTVIGIIDMLSVASGAHTAIKGTEAAAIGASTVAQGIDVAAQETAAAATIPVIAANQAAAASYLKLASAEYFAAHAYIPFAGFEIASGFSLSAAAIVQSMGMMAFANGGLVYGPTLGLFGEYAGAGNNPEVVAPLNRLKQLIQPIEGRGGRVEFAIDGRVLRGVLNKVDNFNNRTR